LPEKRVVVGVIGTCRRHVNHSPKCVRGKYTLRLALARGVRSLERAVGPELRTVEMVFVEAERLSRSNAEDVQVTVDAERGYPSAIAVGRWRRGIDDEWTWRAKLSVPAT
jgi:hypothetical protein